MTEPDPPRLGRRTLLLLFLVAMAVRIAATAWVGFTTIRFGDSRPYLSAARQLVRTGHYPVTTDAFYFRAPGYPVFLVLATFGNPDRIALAKLGNALAGSLAVILVAVLSARIFGSRPLAIATGSFAAVHPSFVLQASDIQSETLFLLLLLATGVLLLAAADRPSSNLALFAGVSLGLAALTRPTSLLLALLLASTLLDRRYPVRARSHLAASAYLGLFLAVAPWLLRNALVFREFIPISDSFGAAFYDGNSEWARRFYQVKTRAEYNAWVKAMEDDRERRLALVDPKILTQPGQRSRYFLEMGLQDLSRDPKESIQFYIRKALQWLRPYPTSWYWPSWIVITTGIYYALLELTALYGLFVSPRRGVSLFCAGVLILTTLGHLLVVPLWRYRVPYWDPILLLYGVFGATRFLEHGSAVRRAVP